MKVLTEDKRRLSLAAAANVEKALARAPKRTEFTVPQLNTAIKDGDTKVLGAFKASVEEDFRSGSLSELSRSLDLLHGTAYENREAGRPLVIEVDRAGFEHTQRLLKQIATVRTHLQPPYGINMARARTERIGQLQHQGIIKMETFGTFASPILDVLEQVSPMHASKLKLFEKETRPVKLDCEIGGKKPASKTGPMMWRPAPR